MLDNAIYKGFSWILLTAVVFFIWHTTIPALGFYTPTAVYAACVLFLYAFIFAAFGNSNELSRIGIIIPILSLYLLGLLYSRGNNLAVTLYGTMQIGLYPLLIMFIAEHCNGKFIRYLFWAVIGSYVFTAITTYIGCILYPGAARTLAIPEEEMGAEVFAMYKMANIGNLTFTYSLVLLLPQIIYMIKSKIGYRLISIIMLLVLTVTILETEYTTALLLMMISYFLFFLPVRIERKHVRTLVFIAIFVFFVGKFIIGDLLVWISTIVSSDTMAIRLNEFGMVLSNGVDSADDGDVGSRMELFNISIKSFLSSPLLGGGVAGGHSLFFDSLARYGFVGLMAFYLSYKKSWKHLYKPFICQPYYGYLMFTFLLVIAMAILNPKDNLGVLTFTIPLFALYYNHKYESSLDC